VGKREGALAMSLDGDGTATVSEPPNWPESEPSVLELKDCAAVGPNKDLGWVAPKREAEGVPADLFGALPKRDVDAGALISAAVSDSAGAVEVDDVFPLVGGMLTRPKRLCSGAEDAALLPNSDWISGGALTPFSGMGECLNKFVAGVVVGGADADLFRSGELEKKLGIVGTGAGTMDSFDAGCGVGGIRDIADGGAVGVNGTAGIEDCEEAGSGMTRAALSPGSWEGASFVKEKGRAEIGGSLASPTVARICAGWI
jgi:hypothetical protein